MLSRVRKQRRCMAGAWAGLWPLSSGHPLEEPPALKLPSWPSSLGSLGTRPISHLPRLLPEQLRGTEQDLPDTSFNSAALGHPRAAGRLSLLAPREQEGSHSQLARPRPAVQKAALSSLGPRRSPGALHVTLGGGGKALGSPELRHAPLILSSLASRAFFERLSSFPPNSVLILMLSEVRWALIPPLQPQNVFLGPAGADGLQLRPP